AVLPPGSAADSATRFATSKDLQSAEPLRHLHGQLWSFANVLASTTEAALRLPFVFHRAQHRTQEPQRLEQTDPDPNRLALSRWNLPPTTRVICGLTGLIFRNSFSTAGHADS